MYGHKVGDLSGNTLNFLLFERNNLLQSIKIQGLPSVFDRFKDLILPHELLKKEYHGKN